MPFYILIFDFVLVLPVFDLNKFNILILMSYKYSKRLTLVLGKDTETVENWAKALFAKLELID